VGYTPPDPRRPRTLVCVHAVHPTLERGVAPPRCRRRVQRRLLYVQIHCTTCPVTSSSCDLCPLLPSSSFRAIMIPTRIGCGARDGTIILIVPLPPLYGILLRPDIHGEPILSLDVFSQHVLQHKSLSINKGVISTYLISHSTWSPSPFLCTLIAVG
jgi:hypothetical protein